MTNGCGSPSSLLSFPILALPPWDLASLRETYLRGVFYRADEGARKDAMLRCERASSGHGHAERHRPSSLLILLGGSKLDAPARLRYATDQAIPPIA